MYVNIYQDNIVKNKCSEILYVQTKGAEFLIFSSTHLNATLLFSPLKDLIARFSIRGPHIDGRCSPLAQDLRRDAQSLLARVLKPSERIQNGVS